MYFIASRDVGGDVLSGEIGMYGLKSVVVLGVSSKDSRPGVVVCTS